MDHGHHHGAAAGIEHPLTPILPNSEGNGSSTTVIEGITVTELLSGEEAYVNVHAGSTGSEELPESVACGDLRKLD